jgi:hypothetical protein
MSSFQLELLLVSIASCQGSSPPSSLSLVLSCLSSLTSASLSTLHSPCRLNPSCLNGLMHSYNITSYALDHSFQSRSSFTLPQCNRLGIAFDSPDHSKETSSANTSQTLRGSVTMMGDNLPEEPEACVVNPGNFSSNSRVLNHRCFIFRGFPRSPICLPSRHFTSLDTFLTLRILQYFDEVQIAL